MTDGGSRFVTAAVMHVTNIADFAVSGHGRNFGFSERNAVANSSTGVQTRTAGTNVLTLASSGFNIFRQAVDNLPLWFGGLVPLVNPKGTL